MKVKSTSAVKHAALLVCLKAKTILVLSQQSVRLSGKITDIQSKAIAGATVHLLNSNKLVMTDEQGQFNFTNLKAGKYQLEITAIGYATGKRDVLVKENGNESISILLTDARLRLD